MFNTISAEVVSNGVKLHYYRTGGKKPPLVLAHGITDDGLCWTPVAEALAEEYDVIMVDLRGHGKSEAPDTGYTLENMASELADLIRKLGIEKPVLLGHSMGAIAALLVAGLFPDLPRAIILEDAPPFWCAVETPIRKSDLRSGLAGWILNNKRKTSEDLFAEGRSNPAWTETELVAWVNSKHRYSPLVIDLLTPSDLFSINFQAQAKRTTCPALFISADMQMGAAASPEEIEKLQSWMPQLKVEHIAGAGHNIRREQFDPYMQVVRKALTDLKNG